MNAEHPLTRQMRLSEVGAEGQARLCSAALEVHGADGALAELVYLQRAGVERLTVLPNLPASRFAHAALFRHESSRRLAAGAWRALSQISHVLAIGSR